MQHLLEKLGAMEQEIFRQRKEREGGKKESSKKLQQSRKRKSTEPPGAHETTFSKAHVASDEKENPQLQAAPKEDNKNGATALDEPIDEIRLLDEIVYIYIYIYTYIYSDTVLLLTSKFKRP